MRGFGLHGGYWSLEQFQIWRLSDYKVLPFDGSLAAQPWWVERDFKTLIKVERWCKLTAKLPDKKAGQNIEDLD